MGDWFDENGPQAKQKDWFDSAPPPPSPGADNPTSQANKLLPPGARVQPAPDQNFFLRTGKGTTDLPEPAGVVNRAATHIAAQAADNRGPLSMQGPAASDLGNDKDYQDLIKHQSENPDAPSMGDYFTGKAYKGEGKGVWQGVKDDASAGIKGLHDMIAGPAKDIGSGDVIGGTIDAADQYPQAYLMMKAPTELAGQAGKPVARGAAKIGQRVGPLLQTDLAGAIEPRIPHAGRIISRVSDAILNHTNPDPFAGPVGRRANPESPFTFGRPQDFTGNTQEQVVKGKGAATKINPFTFKREQLPRGPIEMPAAPVESPGVVRAQETVVRDPQTGRMKKMGLTSERTGPARPQGTLGQAWMAPEGAPKAPPRVSNGNIIETGVPETENLLQGEYGPQPEAKGQGGDVIEPDLLPTEEDARAGEEMEGEGGVGNRPPVKEEFQSEKVGKPLPPDPFGQAVDQIKQSNQDHVDSVGRAIDQVNEQASKPRDLIDVGSKQEPLSAEPQPRRSYFDEFMRPGLEDAEKARQQFRDENPEPPVGKGPETPPERPPAGEQAPLINTGDEPENPSRRNFLKTLGKAGLGAAASKLIPESMGEASAEETGGDPVKDLIKDWVESGVLEDRLEYSPEELISSYPDLNPDQIMKAFHTIQDPAFRMTDWGEPDKFAEFDEDFPSEETEPTPQAESSSSEAGQKQQILQKEVENKFPGQEVKVDLGKGEEDGINVQVGDKSYHMGYGDDQGFTFENVNDPSDQFRMPFSKEWMGEERAEGPHQQFPFEKTEEKPGFISSGHRVGGMGVKPSELIPTEALQDESHVQSLIDRNPEDLAPIDVFSQNGKNFVRDGHHRTLAGISRGDSNISANIFVDPEEGQNPAHNFKGAKEDELIQTQDREDLENHGRNNDLNESRRRWADAKRGIRNKDGSTYDPLIDVRSEIPEEEQPWGGVLDREHGRPFEPGVGPGAMKGDNSEEFNTEHDPGRERLNQAIVQWKEAHQGEIPPQDLIDSWKKIIDQNQIHEPLINTGEKPATWGNEGQLPPVEKPPARSIIQGQGPTDRPAKMPSRRHEQFMDSYYDELSHIRRDIRERAEDNGEVEWRKGPTEEQQAHFEEQAEEELIKKHPLDYEKWMNAPQSASDSFEATRGVTKESGVNASDDQLKDDMANQKSQMGDQLRYLVENFGDDRVLLNTLRGLSPEASDLVNGILEDINAGRGNPEEAQAATAGGTGTGQTGISNSSSEGLQSGNGGPQKAGNLIDTGSASRGQGPDSDVEGEISKRSENYENETGDPPPQALIDKWTRELKGEPPSNTTLWHGTKQEFLPQIMKEGLRKGSFATEDPAIAKEYGRTGPENLISTGEGEDYKKYVEGQVKKPGAVLRINSPENLWDESSGDAETAARENIPPNLIHIENLLRHEGLGASRDESGVRQELDGRMNRQEEVPGELDALINPHGPRGTGGPGAMKKRVGPKPLIDPEVLKEVGQSLPEEERPARTHDMELLGRYAESPEHLTQVAMNRNATPEILRKAYENSMGMGDTPHFNMQLASNPNTPPDILSKLANIEEDNLPGHDSPNWINGVSGKPTKPGHYVQDYRTQHAVARNRNTPPETLEVLSKDPNPEVRSAAQRNPNTPKTGGRKKTDLIEPLTNDDRSDKMSSMDKTKASRGRPKFPEGKAKSNLVNTRVTDDEFKEYSNRAKGEGKTLSQWIRDKVIPPKDIFTWERNGDMVKRGLESQHPVWKTGEVYHGTKLRNIPDILKKGLIPGDDGLAGSAYEDHALLYAKDGSELHGDPEKEAQEMGVILKMKVDPKSIVKSTKKDYGRLDPTDISLGDNVPVDKIDWNASKFYMPEGYKPTPQDMKIISQIEELSKNRRK